MPPLQVEHTPEPETAREVLEYFLSHPAAADSLEGIARWRIMQQRIENVVQETAYAVQWLLSKGLLVESAVSRSGRIYRLNPEKQDLAMRFARKKPRL